MPTEYRHTQRVNSVLTHTFLHRNPKTFLLKKERSRPNGLLDRAVGPWNAVMSPLTRRQYASKGKVGAKCEDKDQVEIPLYDCLIV